MLPLHMVMSQEVLRNVNHSMQINATGSSEKMEKELKAIIDNYQPDELIFYSPIHSLEKRINSFAIAGKVVENMNINHFLN